MARDFRKTIVTGDPRFDICFDFEELTEAQRELAAEEVCAVEGHDYRRLSPLGIKSAPMVVCNLCGHSGWLIAS